MGDKIKISDTLDLASSKQMPQIRGEYITNDGVDALGALVILGNLPDWSDESLSKVYNGDWFSEDGYKCWACSDPFSLSGLLVHMNDERELNFSEIAGRMREWYNL